MRTLRYKLISRSQVAMSSLQCFILLFTMQVLLVHVMFTGLHIFNMNLITCKMLILYFENSNFGVIMAGSQKNGPVGIPVSLDKHRCKTFLCFKCFSRFFTFITFLANVNSCSCSLYVVVRPSVVCLSSVVCNVRAPYSGD